MNRSAITICAVLLAAVGCGKKHDVAQPTPSSDTALRAQAGQTTQSIQADPSAALATLTHALRKYSLENRRVPANLDELVRAGYVQTIPAAPHGKKFAINPKRMEVVLVNE